MRILIATDGKTQSLKAVQLGSQLAQFLNAPLTLLTVIHNQQEQNLANNILTQARAMAGALPQVETKVRIGSAVTEIIAEVSAGNHNLLVIGESHTSELLSRFIPSTFQWLIREAPCSVIVAKEKMAQMARLLVCDSGGRHPSDVVLFTAQLANQLPHPVEVTILHVMSQISAYPGVPGQQLRASAEELMQVHSPEGLFLEEDLHLLEKTPTKIRPKVRHGLVVDEILAEAEEGNYHMIIIGAHRYQGWQRFLLDDLAYEIVTHAEIPVLIVSTSPITAA